MHYLQSEQLQRYQRTPSTTSEDSIRFHSSGSLDLDSKEAAEQPKEVKIESSLEKYLQDNKPACLLQFSRLQQSSSTATTRTLLFLYVLQVELSSSAPTKEPFLRIGSKRMGKNFNPFSSSSSSKPQGAEKESQLPTRLLQLAKPKEKKDKKKKKGKGGEQTQTGTMNKSILTLTLSLVSSAGNFLYIRERVSCFFSLFGSISTENKCIF